MVLIKEYRICMPMTVEEYKVGQVYVVARHSLEQSGDEEGVEVVQNCPCEDPVRGVGKYTEKRIYLFKQIPYWLQTICPKTIYIIEKSWNYYPYTKSEYTCTYFPRFHILIETKYENDDGCSENCLNLTSEQLANRLVEEVDIAYDEIAEKYYRKEEDPRYFTSQRTNRGPLGSNWVKECCPVMCCYKVAIAKFDVWGFQSKAEKFIHTFLRELFLIGHRKAFAWIDDWIGMTYVDVRNYEALLQMQTNQIMNLNEENKTLDEKDAHIKKRDK